MWPLLEIVIKEANRRRGYLGPRKLLGGPLGEELAYHCWLATEGSMAGQKVSHLTPLRHSATTPAKWNGEANHLPTHSCLRLVHPCPPPGHRLGAGGHLLRSGIGALLLHKVTGDLRRLPQKPWLANTSRAPQQRMVEMQRKWFS